MKNAIQILRSALCVFLLCSVTVPVMATADPSYNFYSTSMLSDRNQQSYTPSRLSQDGSVRISNTASYIRDYRPANHKVSGQVYSASAFHDRTAYVSTSGGGIADGARSYRGNRSQGNQLNANVVKVSMPALATHRNNVDALASAAQEEVDNLSTIRKAPPIHGDENGDMPVGDAVLPLLLMAFGYALWRKRKQTSI